MHFKKSTFLFLLLCSVFVNKIVAQNLTQTVKGKVLEQQTGVPLLGVHVVLVNSNPLKGTFTDENGYFELPNIPVGRASLMFTILGFENNYISEIVISSAKEVVLTVEMTESFSTLEEIVIVNQKNKIKTNNKYSVVSGRSFDAEETKRFPSSINDPARMAQSFSGVTTTDDSTNEIIVRGNPSNQLLWRIEGMEVPVPNHFTGTGDRPGNISMLNNNLLGKSDFFTGAFAAEYGNTTAGIFDINLRKGNTETNEYAFQLGVLGTDISAEGPFHKNYGGSYLVNYRYSTLSLLNNIIEISKGGIPTYQDASFKLYFPLSKSSEVSVWGIGGFSKDEKKINRVLIDNEEEDEKEVFQSATYMTGVSFKTNFNSSSRLSVRASFSGTNSDLNYRRVGVVNSKILEINRKNEESAFRFNTDYVQKIGSKSSFKIGAYLNLLSSTIDNKVNDNSDVSVFKNDDKGIFMLQTYAQAKHRFTENITGIFGVHSMNLAINDEITLEPRFGLQWKASQKHILSLGIGKHSRIHPIRQYFIGSGKNKDLKFTKSIHYVLGYKWRIIRNGYFKTEIYYQDLNHIAISGNPLNTNSSANGLVIGEDLVSNGIGKNYGVEFTFEKFFSNNYYYIMSTSLYESKYKASDNNWYNTNFNYKYAANFAVGKEFSIGLNKNTILGISLKSLVSGGRRGTPLTLDAENRIVLNQTLRNTEQFKDFVRLDTSVYFRINKRKCTHTFSIDIQNITNRENIEVIHTNPVTNESGINPQLGLVPVFNYKIQF